MSDQRVALVTGAGRGIGAHLATALADAGYAVVGCSATGRVEGPARTGLLAEGVEVCAVDVTDEFAVHDLVARVMTDRGRIDVLVNNAGVIDDEVALDVADPQQWWRTIEVNVRGPFLLTRMVLPRMLRVGSGRVININSGSGTRAGEVASAYHVSKTALARLTGSTHAAGLGRGVFAFDLMPGVVRTDMTLAMRAHVGRVDWTEPAQVSELALALASGRLDAWSGRFVRAGIDTVAALVRVAERGLNDEARTLRLLPYGEDDPLA